MLSQRNPNLPIIGTNRVGQTHMWVNELFETFIAIRHMCGVLDTHKSEYIFACPFGLQNVNFKITQHLRWMISPILPQGWWRLSMTFGGSVLWNGFGHTGSALFCTAAAIKDPSNSWQTGAWSSGNEQLAKYNSFLYSEREACPPLQTKVLLHYMSGGKAAVACLGMHCSIP